jgi:hypothetical protein
MWEATKTIIDTAAASCPIVVPTPQPRDAACAADLNLVRPHYRSRQTRPSPQADESLLSLRVQDQRVATDDLLFLLASFGRDAPASSCGLTNSPPTLDVSGINTVEEARDIRSYLFCALRDRFFGEAARIQDVFDRQMEICNSTVGELEHDLLESDVSAQIAQFAAQAASEAMQGTIANLTTTVLALEQRMRTLHCAVPVLAHTAIVAGDAVYGGDGIRMECTPGYEDLGPASTFSFECASTGVMVPGPDGVPNCTIMNPCTAAEGESICIYMHNYT